MTLPTTDVPPLIGQGPLIQVDLVVTVGQDLSVGLTLEDPTSGQPLNLAGYTGRVAWTDVPPYATMPELPAVALSGSTSPNVLLTLAGSGSESATWSIAGWKLYLTPPGAAEASYIEGLVFPNGPGR